MRSRCRDFTDSLFAICGVRPVIPRSAAVVLVSSLFVLPLALQRKLSSLALSSLLSVAFVLLLLAALLYRVLAPAPTQSLAEEVSPVATTMSHFIMSITVLVQAYSNQPFALPLFNELQPKHRTLPSFSRVSSLAFTVSALVYLIVGYVSRLRVHTHTQSCGQAG